MAEFNPPLQDWAHENQSFAILYDRARRRGAELAYEVQQNYDHIKRLEARHSAAWKVEQARIEASSNMRQADR